MYTRASDGSQDHNVASLEHGGGRGRCGRGRVHVREVDVMLAAVHLLPVMVVVVVVVVVLVAVVFVLVVFVVFVVFVVVVYVVVVVFVLAADDAAAAAATVAVVAATVAVDHFLFEVQQVFNRVPDASGALFTSDGRPRAFASGIAAAPGPLLSTASGALAPALPAAILLARRRRGPVAVGLAAAAAHVGRQRARRPGGLVTAETGRVLFGLQPQTGYAAGHDVARLGRPVVVHRVRRGRRTVRRPVLRRRRRQHRAGRRRGRVEAIHRRLVVVMVDRAQRVHRPRERLRSQRARHLHREQNARATRKR